MTRPFYFKARRHCLEKVPIVTQIWVANISILDTLHTIHSGSAGPKLCLKIRGWGVSSNAVGIIRVPP